MIYSHVLPLNLGFTRDCTFMWGLFLILGFLPMEKWIGKNGMPAPAKQRTQWMVSLHYHVMMSNDFQCSMMFDICY